MAQGVAYCARRLGVPATIVSPDTAPATKIRAVERLGGRMILATALSLLGAVALSLDVEHVLALVPLPESLAAFARWHWP